MITIVVTHEDDQSDEFDFDSSQSTISIGRRSTNDVCIPNLSVSGRHARIVFNDGEAWVEDLNSTNGTYIHSRLISRQMLNHGDELVIGKTRVRYVNASAGATINALAPDNHAADTQNDSGECAGETSVGSARTAAPIEVPTKPAAQSSEALFESLADDLEERQLDDSLRSSQAPSFDDDFDRLPDDLDDDGGPDDAPMSLSDKAKLALGRVPTRPTLAAVNGSHRPRAFDGDDDVVEAELPVAAVAKTPVAETVAPKADSAAELDTEAPAAVPPAGLSPEIAPALSPAPSQEASVESAPAHEKRTETAYTGAVIEIKNGAKSGQRLPIDKPVTTLGRPGIQIAAIMRKPDGYFLMHIESDDSVDRPTLNSDAIGDEPMLLQSGDELNVAGIDVEFNLA